MVSYDEKRYDNDLIYLIGDIIYQAYKRENLELNESQREMFKFVIGSFIVINYSSYKCDT